MSDKAIKCEQCGKCCEDMYIPIALEDNDNVRWAKLHKGIKVVKYKGVYCIYLRKPCKKLKNGKCTIYNDENK